MDLEDLSKSQMILLVLMVSFITSIATGIMTVALLADAPPSVPQTVNTIIERTVQTIASTTGVVIPKETIKETTVLVKDDAAISTAISNSFAQILAIRSGDATSSPVVGIGVRVGDYVITDASFVTDGTYFISQGSSTSTAKFIFSINEVGVGVLALTKPIGKPVLIADNNSLVLGQTLIGIPLGKEARVSIGALTAKYTFAKIVGAGGDIEIGAVETTGNAVQGGTPLVTPSGAFAGIATRESLGERGSKSTYISLADIASFITKRSNTASSTAQ